MKSVRRKIGNRRSVHLRKKALRRQTKKQMRRQTKRTRRRRKIRSSRRIQRGGGTGYTGLEMNLRNVASIDGGIMKIKNIIKKGNPRHFAVLKIIKYTPLIKEELLRFINSYWLITHKSAERTRFISELKAENSYTVIVLWFDPNDSSTQDIKGGIVLKQTTQLTVQESSGLLYAKKKEYILSTLDKNYSISLSEDGGKDLYNHITKTLTAFENELLKSAGEKFSDALVGAAKKVQLNTEEREQRIKVQNDIREQKLEQIMSFCLDWFEEDDHRYDENRLWREGAREDDIQKLFNKAKNYLENSVDIKTDTDIAAALTQQLPNQNYDTVEPHLLLSLVKKMAQLSEDMEFRFPLNRTTIEDLKTTKTPDDITSILESLSKPRKNIIKKIINNLQKVISADNQMGLVDLTTSMSLGVFGQRSDVLIKNLTSHDVSPRPIPAPRSMPVNTAEATQIDPEARVPAPTTKEQATAFFETDAGKQLQYNLKNLRKNMSTRTI